jgi:hypothetical protein
MATVPPPRKDGVEPITKGFPALPTFPIPDVGVKGSDTGKAGKATASPPPEFNPTDNVGKIQIPVVPPALERLFIAGMGKIEKDDPFGYAKRAVAVQYHSVLYALGAISNAILYSSAVEAAQIFAEKFQLAMERGATDDIAAGRLDTDPDFRREYENAEAQYMDSALRDMRESTRVSREGLKFSEGFIHLTGYTVELQRLMLPSLTGEMAGLMGKYVSKLEEYGRLNASNVSDLAGVEDLREKAADALEEIRSVSLLAGESPIMLDLSADKRTEALAAREEDLKLREEGLALSVKAFECSYKEMYPRMWRAQLIQLEQVVTSGKMLLAAVEGRAPTPDEQRKYLEDIARLGRDLAAVQGELEATSSQCTIPIQEAAIRLEDKAIAHARDTISTVRGPYRKPVLQYLDLRQQMLDKTKLVFARTRQMKVLEAELTELNRQMAALRKG